MELISTPLCRLLETLRLPSLHFGSLAALRLCVSSTAVSPPRSHRQPPRRHPQVPRAGFRATLCGYCPARALANAGRHSVVPTGHGRINQFGSSHRHQRAPGRWLRILHVIPVDRSKSSCLLALKNHNHDPFCPHHRCGRRHCSAFFSLRVSFRSVMPMPTGHDLRRT